MSAGIMGLREASFFVSIPHEQFIEANHLLVSVFFVLFCHDFPSVRLFHSILKISDTSLLDNRCTIVLVSRKKNILVNKELFCEFLLNTYNLYY